MHQTPMKVSKFALVLWLCVFSWSTLRADPINIEVVPSTPAPTVGETFTADVVVSGLGNFSASSLGAFDLNFAFNTSMVSFVGVTFGTLLGDPLAAEAITGFIPTAGNLNAFNVSLLTQAQLDALQPASFTLFTVTLQVVGAGVSSLEVVPTPVLSHWYRSHTHSVSIRILAFNPWLAEWRPLPAAPPQVQLTWIS